MHAQPCMKSSLILTSCTSSHLSVSKCQQRSKPVLALQCLSKCWVLQSSQCRASPSFGTTRQYQNISLCPLYLPAHQACFPAGRHAAPWQTAHWQHPSCAHCCPAGLPVAQGLLGACHLTQLVLSLPPAAGLLTTSRPALSSCTTVTSRSSPCPYAGCACRGHQTRPKQLVRCPHAG